MADQQIVTNIVAKSDFSNLIADVQRVTNSLSKLQQQFAGSNRALAGQIGATNAMFKETMLKTGQFSTHFVSLTSDVEKFGRNLDSGRLKLKDYFRVYQDHTRTTGGLIRDLAKQQTQLQNSVLQPLGRNSQGLMQYNVHIPRGLDLTKNKTALLKQELQIMNKVIQDGGVQLINWGKNTQWAGRQLTVGLTLPLAAFGKAAADAFKVADQELTRLTKVYGEVAGTSAEELSKVRKEVSATAKELSSAMGVNFAETISLAADIAATGKTGNELLSSVSETTRLAVLGEVDRQEAMKATLAIQSAFKSNTEELAQSINFLNAVENQTSTTLQDLVEAIPKAGPVIKGLGGDVQDLALYMTAMREGGINASEGANALKSALASLINPTGVAVDKFKSFGIDLLGIVNNNAGNVTETLMALQASLDRLDPLQKQQAIEQLFGKFQFSRLNALFENLGREGSQTLKVLDLMKASTSDLEAVATRELAAVTDSAAGRYKRAIEGLKADLAGVGEDFLDIGTKLLNVLGGIIDFAQKLPDPIKKLMTFGGAFTAILGPVIMLTGVLANFFGYIIKGLGHFKALFKGAEGFKLLTPEIMAAQDASKKLGNEFYSDSKAAATLSLAIKKLSEDLVLLEANARKATASTATLGSVMTTAAGTPVMNFGASGQRVVDKDHPLLGGTSRAAAHLNPRDPDNPTSIFGLTLQPVPVNRNIGANPQILMNERLPDVSGLTTINGVSTGVVASQHARYTALMGALGVQSKAEIDNLKKLIGMGGQVSKEFIDTFDDILPITQRLTANAAAQSAQIVGELKAGKINIQQARAAIIASNAELERMMGVEVSAYAASRGRTIDLTKAPLIDQPVVDVKGKPNTRGMFRQGIFADVMAAVGKATKTRTMGGPYSIETTRPQGLNSGGNVFYNNGDEVPGPNVDADVVPAMLTPGEFVIRRGIAQQDPDGMRALNEGRAMVVPLQGRNVGGSILGGGIVSSSRGGYGPRPTLSMISSMLSNSPWSRAVPRRTLNVRGKPLHRHYFSTGTGAHPGSRRIDLIQSHDAGWKIKDPKTGAYYTKEQLQNLNDNEVNNLWSGIDRSHFSTPVHKTDTGQYIMPALFGPQTRSGEGGNLSLITGGNPKLILEALSGGLMHPFSTMMSSARMLGYPSKKINKVFADAWEDAQSQLTSRRIPFGKDTNTFEEFMERILRRHLAKLKIQGSSSNYFDEMRQLGNLRGSQISGSGPAVYNKDNSDISFNKGGMVPGVQYFGSNIAGRIVKPLSKKVIDRITAKWKPQQQFRMPGYQYALGNQDPLHGPLQVGRSMVPKNFQNDPEFTKEVLYKDDRFARQAMLPQFLTGNMEERGKYATAQYMSGNLDIMSQMQRLGNHPLGPIAAMKTLQRKFTGKLFRGIRLDKTFKGLPQDLIEAIGIARSTGDVSGLIGREFIMRRSSWSKSPTIASYFAPGSGVDSNNVVIEAAIKNRNILPAGDMFPNKKFLAPYGQDWSGGSRFGGGHYKSEQEAIFGGKFRVVGFDKGKLQVETVVDGARKDGGPVNAGRPYLVGEDGPEVFVPRNSGGIVPGYAMGGMVKGYNKGGMIVQLLASILGGSAGQALGSKFGGSGGSMIGGILGSILLPGMFGSRGSGITPQQRLGRTSTLTPNLAAFGKPMQEGVPLAFNTPIEQISKGRQSIFAQGTPVLGKYAGGVEKIATSSNTFAKISGKVLLGITRTNLALAAGTTIVAGAYKAWKNYNETQRLSAAAFGLTAESAEKAGLKYTNYTSKIKDSVDSIKLLLDNNKLIYESLQSAGTPFKMTIQEYKKLQKEVKTTMKDQIDLISATKSKDINQVAIQLKEQFVAAGMSAEEATKKIYVLFKLSNKPMSAVSAISSKGFGKIRNQETAAVSAVGTFNLAKDFQNTKDAAAQLNTALTAIDSGVENIMKTSEEAAKKDKSGKTQKLSLYEAENKQISMINAKVKEQKPIGDAVLQNLIKQNPEVKKFATASDTILSIWQKLRIQAAGFAGDLTQLNTGQIDQLYKLSVAVQKAVVETNKTNLLKKQYENLDKLTARQKELLKASKGQSVAQQISDRDAIRAIDKKIKKINEEADARKKALQDQAAGENYQLELQKAQLEYQQNIATGDMQAAAQAQLRMREIVSGRQTTLAMNKIDADREAKVKPLEAQREAIQDKNQKLADAAALAGDSLDKLNAKIENQTKEIDGVNGAMSRLKLALLANKDDLAKFKTTAEFKGLAADFLNEVKKAGISTGTANMPDVVGGKLGPEDIATTAMNLLSGLDKGLSEALSKEGISTTGDIYINGKKLDMSKEGAPQYGANNPLKVNSGAGFRSYELNERGTLSTQGGKQLIKDKGLKPGDFVEYKGVKYRIYGPQGNLDPNSWSTRAQGKAMGGIIRGPGTGTSDSIPAMLSSGEYVIRAQSVQNVGLPLLDRINGMAMGGLATKYKVPSSTSTRVSMAQGGQPPMFGSNVVMQNTYNIPQSLTKEEIGRYIVDLEVRELKRIGYNRSI